MDKPKGYDETQVMTAFPKLVKGGYICKIKKIEETKSKASGADQLVIYLDIADGEFKNYFAERYRTDTREVPRWGCIAYQLIYDSTTGATNSRFKAFLTAVEESNPGFVVDKTWGDNFTKFYKDKFIGYVFGDEHYTKNNGENGVIAKPRFAVSVDRIKKNDYKVPEDTYSQNFKRSDSAPPAYAVDTVDVDDDDLPF